MEKQIPSGKRIRLGGLVANGSLKRARIRHRGHGTVKTIPVRNPGLLFDLFRDGQSVVAGGKLGGGGRFLADTVLAKHDENYMPPEVAKARYRRLSPPRSREGGRAQPECANSLQLGDLHTS